MRIFSKLLVLGAALTVSTSLAYADSMGAVSLSTNVGVTVNYSDTGVNYTGGVLGINANVQDATGTLSGYLGALATLDDLSFISNGTIGPTEIFSAFTLIPANSLSFYLTSGTWSIDSGTGDLTIAGLGYFDNDGTDTAGGISITGSDNGILQRRDHRKYSKRDA